MSDKMMRVLLITALYICSYRQISSFHIQLRDSNSYKTIMSAAKAWTRSTPVPTFSHHYPEKKVQSKQGHENRREQSNAIVQLLREKGFQLYNEGIPFTREVQKMVPHLNSQELAVLLQSLHNLKLPSRSKEMLGLSDALLERLDQVASTASINELSTSLMCLAKLGIKCNINTYGSQVQVSAVRHRKEQLPSFLEALPRVLEQATPYQLSHTIWALGKLGADWDLLHLHIQSGFMSAVSKLSAQMKANDVATAVYGLSAMKASWDTLPHYVKFSITDALDRTLREMGEQESSNCIGGLGRMGARWDLLPPSVRSQIGEAFVRNARHLNTKGLTMSVYGFGRMSADIEHLPHILSENILEALVKFAPEFNAQEIANVLHGLGKMEARFNITGTNLSPYRYIPRDVRNGLLEALTREAWQMNSMGVSNALFGLKILGVKWDTLAADNQDAILQAMGRELNRMESFELENTLWALGMMEFDLLKHAGVDMTQLFLRVVEEKLQFMKPESVIRSLMSLGKLKLEYNKLPQSLKYRIEETAMKILPTISDKLFSDWFLDALVILQAHYSDFSYSFKTSFQEAIARTHWELQQTKGIYDGDGKNIDSSVNSIDSSKTFVLHYVTHLSHLEMTWDDASLSARISMQKSLIQAFQSLKDNTLFVVNTIFNFAQMGVQWSDLRTDFKKAMMVALLSAAPDMCGQSVGLTLMALQKLQVSWSDLPIHLQTSLDKALLNMNGIEEQAYANNLYCMAKMGRTWQTIPRNEKHSIIRTVAQYCKKDEASSLGLSNSLFGLSTMGLPWSELSSPVQTAILKSVWKVMNRDLSNSHYGSLLNSLGKMGFTFDQVKVKGLKPAILYELERKADSMGEQSLSNSIFALGSMGVEWHSLPTSTMKKIGRTLSRLLKPTGQVASQNMESFLTSTKSFPDFTFLSKSPYILAKGGKLVWEEESTWMMEAQGLSMTLVGLSKMKAQWVLLHPTMSQALLDGVWNMVESMSASNLARTLQGLSVLGIRWEHFIDSMKRKVIKSLARSVITSTASPADLSLALHSLGKMGLGWGALQQKSSTLCRSIMKGVHMVLREGAAEEVSNILEGLAQMDCSWSNFSDRTKNNVMDCVDRLFPIQQRKKWSMQRSRSVPVISPSSLSSIMYSLSLLSFDAPETALKELMHVHYNLVDALQYVDVMALKEAERERVVIYMNTLQTLLPSHENFALDRVQSIVTIRPDSDKPPLRIISKLQESVIQVLKSALKQRDEELEVQDEYSAFAGAFPVDATIFEHGKAVAFIEVDGPHHYDASTGGLRRKDILKEALYRRKYPCASFTRLRFDQIDRLGCNFVGREVANYITLSKHCCLCELEVETSSSPNYSTEPDYLHEDHSLAARRAQLRLQQSLESNKVGPLVYLTSPFTDFAFAEIEEDNS